MIDLIYYVISLLLALVMFFLRITAPNATLEILFRGITKVSSLFVMLYSGIQVFKYYGVI